MKPEEFRKKKEKHQKRVKRIVTDEEFEKWLRRDRKIGLILWPICLVMGLAMALELPGPWLGSSIQFVSYLGWAIVLFSVFGLIQLARSWKIR